MRRIAINRQRLFEPSKMADKFNQTFECGLYYLHLGNHFSSRSLDLAESISQNPNEGITTGEDDNLELNLDKFDRLNNMLLSKQINITKITDKEIQISNLIDSGCFSKVFLSKNTFNGQKYAIKCIKYKNCSKREFQSIVNEMEILYLATKSNNHFVSHISSYFHKDKDICLCLEYIPGGNLLPYLKRSQPSEAQIKFYSACVVLGLEFLHNNKIIYRDLKAENVMIASDGYAKLIDFGLSELGIDHNAFSGKVCGSYIYMSPEMIQKGWHTRDIDWWSLGVLIYYMFHRKFPFMGFTVKRLYHSICDDQVRFGRRLKRESMNIILDLLTKDPTKRLGNSVDGANAVLNHPFFADLDVTAIRERTFLTNSNFNVFSCLERPFFEEIKVIKPKTLAPPTNGNKFTRINRVYSTEKLNVKND